jgi:hypothetical protein
MVYSEELIDKRVVKTTRSVNERLGTIDYLDSKGHVVFRKVPGERVVVQVCTVAIQCQLSPVFISLHRSERPMRRSPLEPPSTCVATPAPSILIWAAPRVFLSMEGLFSDLLFWNTV